MPDFDPMSQVEQDSGALRIIDNEHAMAHFGRLFSAEIHDAALANNGELLIQFDTPATGEMHLKKISLWLADSVWTIEILEAPTHTTGSTAIAAINHNRRSTRVTANTLFSDPTGISGGTDLMDTIGGGGTGVGQVQTAESGAHDMEFELKASTTYIIRVKNTSGGAAAGSLRIHWYELRTA